MGCDLQRAIDGMKGFLTERLGMSTTSEENKKEIDKKLKNIGKLQKNLRALQYSNGMVRESTYESKPVVDTYEVSSKGDKRFSALFAKFKDGKTVEQKWAEKKGYGSIEEAKNKPAKSKDFNYEKEYFDIWRSWAKENPRLVEELRVASKGKKLSDQFAKTGNNQAAALTQVLKETEDKKDFEKEFRSKRPSAVDHVGKEVGKYKMATQAIADGKTDSTAGFVKEFYGDKANTGEYTKNDVVYVSTNGNRAGRVAPVKDGKLQGEYKNLDKAMSVGATIVADTKAHLDKTGKYNVGELEIAEYLSKNGYERVEDTKDGVGIWKKAEKKADEGRLVWNEKAGTVTMKDGKTSLKVETLDELVELSKEFNKLVTKGDEKLNKEENVKWFEELFRELDKKGINFKPVTLKFDKSLKMAGQHTTSTGTITLNPTIVTDAYPMKVVLHEYAHAITAKGLAEDKVAKKFVEDLMEHVKKENPGIEKMYGMTNADEFLAEAVSSPKFQRELSKISPFRGRGIVESVKAVFNRLLGRLGVKEANALTEALEVVVKIANGEKMEEEENALTKYQRTYGGIDDISWMEEEEPTKTEKPKANKESLTEEQQEVFDSMLEFFENGKDNKFVLDAAGGTGKTYTVGKVADALKAQGIGIKYLAPTHAAKEVLIAQGIKKVNTLASALGYKLDEATGKFERDPEAESKISAGDYVVVDESSMLTEAMYGALMGELGKEGKVVFMGDRAQLPPIRTEEDNKNKKSEVSPALEAMNGETVKTLTKVVRFDEKSKIGSITKDLRENSLKDKPENVYEVLKDVKAEGNLVVVGTLAKAVDRFVEQFKENKSSVIVTFNNQTRMDISQSVGSLNKTIREKLEPKYMNEFVKGDVIVAYNTLTLDEDNVIGNSSRMEISSASDPKNKTYNYEYKSKYGRVEVQETVEVQTVTTVDGKKFDVLTPKGKIGLANRVKELEAKAKVTPRTWSYVYGVKQLTAQKALDAEFGYAVTSHKAQGQSYDNVVVMLDNINGGTGARDPKSKAAATYVAMSRPKKELTVMTTRLVEGNTSGISNQNQGTIAGTIKNTIGCK